MSVDDLTTPSDRRSYVTPPRSRRRIDVLKLVDPDTLISHDHECAICAREYETTTNSGLAESPAKLRCKPVVGQDCVLQWLGGENSGQVPRCQLCKNALFGRAGGAIVRGVG